jgi:hypothetical protein
MNVPLPRLRAIRNRPAPDLSITAEIDRLAADAARRRRAGTAASAAWAAVAPPRLGAAAQVALSRGVLTLRCPDASTRYAIDRWLRTGGEAELIRRCGAAVTRVRVAP